ncbi:MAG: AmmeMemoRadiSam system protein B [Candidatus Methylomirabilales bacterium]
MDGADGAYEYPRLRPVEVLPLEVRGEAVFCLRDPLHYAEEPLYLRREVAPLLALFDGCHSVRDIQLLYARRAGTLLFREALDGLIRELDAHLYLEGPRFRAHRAELERAFREAPSRPARLAGQSYPAEPEALRRELSAYFDHPDGPDGSLPSPEAARLAGLILPHIDFQRGGPCYAWGYREAAGAPTAARYVVLGTAHAPMTQPFAITRKDFETPLGAAEADHDFLDGLLRRVDRAYLADEFVHRAEHSIEFQAVFLRHQAAAGQPVRIVPVLCGSFHRFVEAERSPAQAAEVAGFLAALREAIAAAPGRTLVVASADLAHVGPQFGDRRPVTPGRLREVAEEDGALLAAAEAGDPEAVFAQVMREGDRRRICGLPPIYAALSVLPGVHGRRLRYGQWPDPQASVTFAAMALYGGPA